MQVLEYTRLVKRHVFTRCHVLVVFGFVFIRTTYSGFD